MLDLLLQIVLTEFFCRTESLNILNCEIKQRMYMHERKNG